MFSVLVFRKNISLKGLGRFKWCKKYKSIVNIPLVRNYFKVYRTFVTQIYFMMRGENVEDVNIGPRGNTQYQYYPIECKTVSCMLKQKVSLAETFSRHSIMKVSQHGRAFYANDNRLI